MDDRKGNEATSSSRRAGNLLWGLVFGSVISSTVTKGLLDRETWTWFLPPVVLAVATVAVLPGGWFERDHRRPSILQIICAYGLLAVNLAAAILGSRSWSVPLLLLATSCLAVASAILLWPTLSSDISLLGVLVSVTLLLTGVALLLAALSGPRQFSLWDWFFGIPPRQILTQQGMVLVGVGAMLAGISPLRGHASLAARFRLVRIASGALTLGVLSFVVAAIRGHPSLLKIELVSYGIGSLLVTLWLFRGGWLALYVLIAITTGTIELAAIGISMDNHILFAMGTSVLGVVFLFGFVGLARSGWMPERTRSERTGLLRIHRGSLPDPSSASLPRLTILLLAAAVGLWGFGFMFSERPLAGSTLLLLSASLILIGIRHVLGRSKISWRQMLHRLTARPDRSGS